MITFDHFYNIHYGETGLIICNGPSLRDVPDEFLKKYKNFGLNNIWLREKFTPDYYIACDPLAIRASIAEILDIDTVKFIRNDYRLPDVYPLAIIPHPNEFSIDIAWGVVEGHSVTNVALQIAYYMGFETILIVGLDHRFTYQGPPDIMTETLAEDTDVNHFSPDYFRGKPWNTPNLPESARHFAIARKYYESARRRIVNLTPDTALDVFEKDSIENW